MRWLTGSKCCLQTFHGDVLERATKADAQAAEAALLVCQLHEQEQHSKEQDVVIEQLVSEVEALGDAGMAFAARYAS